MSRRTVRVVTDSQQDPVVQRKARRTIVLLYVLTAGMILLPLVLWWFLKR